MGLFRLFLALTVLAAHIGFQSQPGKAVVDGTIAVRTFFVISGFYMGLVLNEKYNKIHNSYRVFITNRFLRIYPIYWIILIPTVAIYFKHFSPTSIPLNPVTIIQNIFLFINPNYYMVNGVEPKNFIIAPAWTLGLELVFYLVIPFMARNVRVLTGVFIVSLFAHYTLSSIPFFEEFCFFIFGSLSYQIYKHTKFFDLPINFKTGVMLFLLAVIFLIPQNYFPFMYFHNPFVQEILYYPVLFFFIPVLFRFSAKNTIDRFVAELSYPVYISHTLILHFIQRFFSWNPGIYFGVGTVIVLAVSYGLIKCIDEPVERYKLLLIKENK